MFHRDYYIIVLGMNTNFWLIIAVLVALKILVQYYNYYKSNGAYDMKKSLLLGILLLVSNSLFAQLKIRMFMAKGN